MRRAAGAVASAVRSRVEPGKELVIFAGKGNNGGDGYAAATLLMDEYKVTVYDVFSLGQRTDEGRYFLDLYASRGGLIIPLDLSSITARPIYSADCIVDAVFGTGFSGEYPTLVRDLSRVIASLDGAVKIAVDLPLGVNAADGSVDRSVVYSADITVALGFVKPGLVSYPAKKYVGKLVYDNIDLHNEAILSEFDFNNYAIDLDLATALIPDREDNSNKGSFGKALLVTGSVDFLGAAALTLEAALRSGVGLVTYAGEKAICNSLVASFPEAIYKPLSVTGADDSTLNYIVELSHRHNAVLIGSGSSRSEGLLRLVRRLLSDDGAPIVLDADAINVLSEGAESARQLLRSARRTVVLTPHPLELSRLTGIPTEEIQEHRLAIAVDFARENNCVLVLKGAATVVTDGNVTYLNTSGSSALAKAGSGDVLAGMLTSVIASGVAPLSAAALSVYFHGLGADSLAAEYSTLGVTPSDLPREIARQLQRAISHK